MVMLVAIGIAMVVLIVLGYPLFFKRGGDEALVELYGESRLRELLSRKESFYSTIKELDFDFKTAKLSLEDYKELRERYQGEALSLLKEIDEMEKGEVVETIIEKEILFRRKSPSLSGKNEGIGKSENMEAAIEKDILTRRKSLSLCPDCGARRRQEDTFCSHCGRKLK